MIDAGQSSGWLWTKPVLPLSLCSSYIQLQRVLKRQSFEMGEKGIEQSMLNRMSSNHRDQYIPKSFGNKIQGGVPFGTPAVVQMEQEQLRHLISLVRFSEPHDQPTMSPVLLWSLLPCVGTKPASCQSWVSPDSAS
jgi:hypothetical protein